MPQMAMITKSYAPDYELCADLHRSVLKYAPTSVHHQIIVPRQDLEIFRQLAGPRTHIRCESDLLPSSFLRVPSSNMMINLRRPFPPVRGWILQQVVKLAAAAASQEDLVLLVDSDVEFIRPFTADAFLREGAVRFYRVPHEVDQRLPRHMAWHQGARRLLGLPAATPPYADYIAAMIACDPKIVQRMLARVTATTGQPWLSALAAQLHFSEWTLYGVFVDEVMGSPASTFASDDPLCLAHWGTEPLNSSSAAEFFRGLRPTDIAAMISAKSGTPLAIKRSAFAQFRDAEGASC